MSVMIDTSLGEVVVDLFCDEAPLAAKNFLKLCKIKYYNGCLFYNVQQNFMIQTGDPTASGKGGTSAYGIMYGEQARFFEDEIKPTSRKHNEAGLLSMANMGMPDSNGSQFFFSMRGDDMQHLDGKHTVFAKVMEGMETLEEINGQFCDDHGRPYRDIRILHTYVLDDPFDDPPQLSVPNESPLRDRPEEERVPLRLGALDKVSLEADEKTEIEREKQLREKTARSNAVVLEMIGDLPDADMKPPENVLFVCKLNPVTTDDDLEIIFTRFGTCRAEICRDHVTGDSLNYAFVEFEAIESCEEAFKKMNNVLIDDRRIRVDFSQSVAKEWSKYKGRAQGGQKLASGKGGKPMQPHLQNQNQHQQHQQHQQQQWQPKGGGGSASSASQKRRSKWGNAPTPTPTAALSAAVAPLGSTVTPSRDGVYRGGGSHSGQRDGERLGGASRWSSGAVDKDNGGGGGGGGGDGGGGGSGEGGGEGRMGNGRGVRERSREEDRRGGGGRRRHADGEWGGVREVDGQGRGGKGKRDNDGLDKERRDKGGRDNDGGAETESRRAPERRESGGGGGGREGRRRSEDIFDDNGSDGGGGGGGRREGGSRGGGAERESRGSGRSAKGGGGGGDDDGRGHRVSVRSSTGDGHRGGDRGRGDAENGRGGKGGERGGGRDERNDRDGRGGSDRRGDRDVRGGREDRNGGRGERDERDDRKERGGRDGKDRERDRGRNRDGRSARKRSRSRSRSQERARGRSGSRDGHGRR